MAVSNRMKSVRGFTLVELVIVMTLLAILSLMVTPVFRASFSGVRSDHAMRDLFAAMKSAQAGAITRAVEHRFYFAPEDNEYWIAREVVPEAGEPTFEALEGRAGEVVKLPQGLEMQKPSARRGRESGTYYVSFYPNGACDIATVKVALSDDPRAEYAIETTGIMVLFGAPES